MSRFGCMPEKTAARHGTESMYIYGCRCEPCLRARNIAKSGRRYRNKTVERKVPSHLVRPLVDCLVSFGVQKRKIAQAAPCSEVTLKLRCETVHARTARRLEKLHWDAWLSSAALQRHCRCDMPQWVRDIWESL